MLLKDIMQNFLIRLLKMQTSASEHISKKISSAKCMLYSKGWELYESGTKQTVDLMLEEGPAKNIELNIAYALIPSNSGDSLEERRFALEHAILTKQTPIYIDAKKGELPFDSIKFKQDNFSLILDESLSPIPGFILEMDIPYNRLEQTILNQISNYAHILN